MTNDTSEFGTGLTYCLGLFLCHQERDTKVFSKPDEMWFYGAADHLFDFQADQAPKGLKARCKRFREKCLTWRLAMGDNEPAEPKDKLWAINEAKVLLYLIDRANGITVAQAENK